MKRRQFHSQTAQNVNNQFHMNVYFLALHTQLRAQGIIVGFCLCIRADIIYPTFPDIELKFLHFLQDCVVFFQCLLSVSDLICTVTLKIPTCKYQKVKSNQLENSLVYQLRGLGEKSSGPVKLGTKIIMSGLSLSPSISTLVFLYGLFFIGMQVALGSTRHIFPVTKFSTQTLFLSLSPSTSHSLTLCCFLSFPFPILLDSPRKKYWLISAQIR